MSIRKLAIMRRSAKRLSPVAILIGVAVAAMLIACSSGSRLGQVAVKGVEAAADAFAPAGDDLVRAAQAGEKIEVPPALREAIEGIPAGELSAEDQAIAKSMKQWDSTLGFWNASIEWASGWESGLPGEAASLVAAALLTRDSKLAFQADLDALVQRLLRSATCKGARTLLDAAAIQAADEAGVVYDEGDPSDESGAEAFLRGALQNDWDAASIEATVDLAALASATIAKAKGWYGGLEDVAESPNGTILGANIFYFRACVVRG